jgi:coenzyme PQQ precursor peptide PqqA
VGDPEHDRFGRSVFHAVGKRPHFLAPPAPVIWVIGEQARRRGLLLGMGRNAKEENCTLN